MMKNELLTVEEAAIYLQLNEQTVRAMARDGRLPAFKVGRSWRFSMADMDAHLKQAAGGGTQILIIDDDPLVHGLLEGSLHHCQHVVHSALNGKEGLGLLASHDIDIIFLDLSMPGIEGPETLRNIREMRGQIPVVIITSYPESKLMEEAMKYGPLILLAKPFMPHQVIDCLDNLSGTSTP